MEQENCQKIKLLKLMELLRQETDEDHPMPTHTICEKLVAMGITCDPRTLHKDMKVLNRHGYEVIKQLIDHENCYYVCDRSFSVPEIKILIDAAQAASFITEKKTGELIDKLADLGGSHRAEILKSNMVRFNTRKHSNETVYYTVDFLEQAIQMDRKVSFRYFDLDENHERVYRKDGQAYVRDPVALVFSEDNYYLTCLAENHDGPGNYRIDRMDSVAILMVPVSEQAKELREEMGDYTESMFHMYSSPATPVTLEFDRKFIGAVYDKFGEDTKIERIGESRCRTTVDVQVSPTFFGWVFQFGGAMVIAGPEDVAEEYCGMAADLTKGQADETYDCI